MSSPFGNLYDYSATTGLVTTIPDYDTLRENVVTGFKGIFGQDFDSTPSTPNGLLIDAITTLMFDTLGICAQNANGLNMDVAVGQYLDAIGRIFGVTRNGDSDDAFRIRIKASMGRGSGTAMSVSNALSNLDSVVAHVVLENNTGTPKALPEGADNAITVAPHSLYVSCARDIDTTTSKFVSDVGTAIYDCKIAGCGLDTENHGDGFAEVQEYTITDSKTNSENTMTFVESENVTWRYILTILINVQSYTGTNIGEDITNAIKEGLGRFSTCKVVTKAELAAYIAEFAHAVATEITIEDINTGVEVDRIIIQPYEYIDAEELAMNVNLDL